MKAVVWCAPYKVKVEEVPDPKILNRRDAVVRLTSTCICGSDLHLVDGFVPFMKPGDIIGHEPMGIVEDVGPDVDTSKVKVGDRVIVPFTIGCGNCWFCKSGLWSCCDNTNPKPYIQENLIGHSASAAFGYSHMTGGFRRRAGAVPPRPAGRRQLPGHADRPGRSPDRLPLRHPAHRLDGGQALQHSRRRHGRRLGLRPVGQFTIASAKLLGARQVVAIDNGRSVPERLQMAREQGAITIDTASRTCSSGCWTSPAASGRTSASTPSAWKRTAPTCSSTRTTRPRRC
jgi:threonine dehydrogenase-like Zn-dependent dehydrogenase